MEVSVMLRKRWLWIFVLVSLLVTNGALFAQDAAESTEAAPLELTEHYVSDDEQVAFSYPEGWVLDPRSPSEGYYLDTRLMSSQDIAEQDFAIFGDGLNSGEVFMQPIVVERSALVEEMASDITLESSMEDILEKVLEFNTD